jgi:heterodisulfide reductase subunit A-like polyferredoxin
LKIGLFFSEADGNISKVLNLEKLQKSYQGDFETFIVKDFFLAPEIGQILKAIAARSFDAIILAGDSPVNFQVNKNADFLVNEIEKLGINSNRIGIVNLKEQLAMAHPEDPAGALKKAGLLIDVAIAKVKMAPDIKTREIAPYPAVAVIGITPGSIMAAQRLLERDFTVYLIDDTREIRNFRDGEKRRKIRSIVSFVELRPNAKFYFSSKITDVYGYAGNYTLEVSSPQGKQLITAGSIIVANTRDREFTDHLRPLVHIDIDEDGLFEPVNNDTLQVFTLEKGIFLLADDEDSDLACIAALGDSVAFAVTSLLESRTISYKIVVSEIYEELCGGCGTCVKTCMFRASGIDPVKKVSIINEKRCKGCGNCVTSCPTGARDLLTYPQKYLTKAIEILASDENKNLPKILAFLCEGCGYEALDKAGLEGIPYPASIMPLGIRCAGNIDTQLILEAFIKGFSGVVVCKCPDGHCRNIVGNSDLDRRANLFREVLRSRGIEDSRLRIVEGELQGSNNCAKAILELFKELQTVGGDR